MQHQPPPPPRPESGDAGGTQSLGKLSPASLQGVTEEDSFVLSDEEAIRQVKQATRRCDAGQPATLRVVFHNVPSRLQDGPTCGLMALIMAADHLVPAHGVSSARLLRAAVDRGYSSRGEMFHAANLAELARQVFDLDTACESDWDVPGVAHHIMCGGLALVPYDVGPDHSPILAGGAKSHWVLLCGVVCVAEEGEIMVWQAAEAGEGECVAFVGLQAKSRRLAVWQGDALRDSNCNLFDAAERKAQGMVVGGAALEGMRGKVVLLTLQKKKKRKEGEVKK